MSAVPRTTLQAVLQSVHRRRQAAAALYGIFLTGAALALLVGIAVGIEAAAHLEPTGRLALWGAVIVGGGVLGVGAFRKGWRSVGDMGCIAADIEGRYPQFRERLIAGWEFETKGVRGSQSLADAVIAEAAALVRTVDLWPLTDWRPVLRAGALVTLASALLAGAFLLWPGTLTPALARLMSPTQSFRPPLALRLLVEPGDTRLARGDTLTVRVGFEGERPLRLAIMSRDLDAQVWRRDVVSVPDSEALVWQWPQMRGDAEYQVIAGEAKSPVYHVSVIERPAVRRLRVALDYPRYTGQKSDTLAENEGNVNALVGTDVIMNVQANKPLVRASVIFSSGDTLSLSRSGRQATGTWKVRRDEDYFIALSDEFGYESRNPISYHVHAIEDVFPSVRIAEPERETDLGQDMLVGLRVEVMDDYGFDRLELHYRGPDGQEKVTALPLASLGRGHAQARYVWDVGGFDLLPEDRITYRAVVYDNDRIHGPKRSESEEYTLRFPSVMEVFAEAQAEQQTQITSLSEIVRRGQETQQRLEALQRELLKTQDLTWESRQEAQRLAEQQRQMNENLRRTSDALKNTLDQLQRHSVLSPETMDKMLQIQQMMSSIITPELRQALEQMQSSLQQMASPEQVQQAMQQLSERRQEFDQKLDRMLSLLREAQADQQLDAMSKRLQELARLQHDVEESFLRQSPQVLANRERGLGDQVADAQQRLERMAEEMRDLKASPSDSLRSIARDLEQDRVAERLGRLGERLASVDPQDRGAQREQLRPEAERLGQLLDQAAQAMQQTAQSRRNQRREEIARKLDRAATDFLRLSMMQEQLRGETLSGAAREKLGTLGEEQVDLAQATSGVIGRVIETARETFLISPEAMRSMGDAVTNMQAATSALEQQNSPAAESNQQRAMAALNQAVERLRASSGQARSSQSGTGLEQLMQQLADMAQRQQQLNQMADQMGQQGGLSPSDLQALAQMAAQQRALGEAMRQLADQLNRYRQTLGRLGDLAGEMEQAAAQMERGQLGPRLQDRQRRILQRLLDAQRSLQQDKMGEERVARTAKDYLPRDPGALPADRGERRIYLQEALLEALRANYPPEYREWIRHYYEELLTRETPTETESRPPGQR